MRDKAVAGLLFVVGLMLIATGFPGTLGDLLAAIFAPESLTLTSKNEEQAPALNGGGTSGGF